MMTKNNILKMVKSVARHGQGRRSTRLVHPARDWMIGLLLEVVLLMVASACAAYVFVAFSDSADEAVPIESAVIVYQQSKVSSVLEVYQRRAALFETLRAERSVLDLAPIQEEEDTGEETSEGMNGEIEIVQ
jgi:hypothetical protein